jgi:hypothetical protein
MARIYALRAESHRRLGHREQASADGQQALALDPGCALAREILTTLERAK